MSMSVQEGKNRMKQLLLGNGVKGQIKFKKANFAPSTANSFGREKLMLL